MKTHSLALLWLFVFVAGCTGLQIGGQVQSGRQALIKGNNEAALGYFYGAEIAARGKSPETRRSLLGYW